MNRPVEVGASSDEMPFPPAVVTRGGMIYLSGATAYPLTHKHPHDEKELRVPGDIGDQTRACLENLQTALEAAGGQVKDIVKVTIYNTAMNLQDEVNQAYTEFFGRHRPARSHVGVSQLVGPDVKVEIEAIAVIEE